MTADSVRFAEDFIEFCDGLEAAGQAEYARRGRVVARELIEAIGHLEAARAGDPWQGRLPGHDQGLIPSPSRRLNDPSDCRHSGGTADLVRCRSSESRTGQNQVLDADAPV